MAKDPVREQGPSPVACPVFLRLGERCRRGDSPHRAARNCPTYGFIRSFARGDSRRESQREKSLPRSTYESASTTACRLLFQLIARWSCRPPVVRRGGTHEPDHIVVEACLAVQLGEACLAFAIAVVLTVAPHGAARARAPRFTIGANFGGSTALQRRSRAEHGGASGRRRGRHVRGRRAAETWPTPTGRVSRFGRRSVGGGSGSIDEGTTRSTRSPARRRFGRGIATLSPPHHPPATDGDPGKRHRVGRGFGDGRYQQAD